MPKGKKDLSTIPVKKETLQRIKKLKVGGETFDTLLNRKIPRKKKGR